jgi:hypothetical protein
MSHDRVENPVYAGNMSVLSFVYKDSLWWQQMAAMEQIQ